MSATSVDENRDSKTLTVYWGSSYFFSVAVLYLWGYWSPFNINILEYLSLSDVVKTAAYPIASFFVFMAIGAVLGEVLFPHGLLPPGGGAKTKVGGWLRRATPVIAAIYMLGIVLLFIFGPIEKWRVFPVLIALPASIALNEARVLKTIVKSDRVRSSILFLLAALPPFAYGHGTLRANDIIAGKAYTYLISEIQGHPRSPDTVTSLRFRYVGKAGEQYFLYSPETHSVLVLPMSEAKVFELKVEDGKTTSPASSVSAPASAALASQAGKK